MVLERHYGKWLANQKHFISAWGVMGFLEEDTLHLWHFVLGTAGDMVEESFIGYTSDLVSLFSCSCLTLVAELAGQGWKLF